jgi:hypothetical protein
MMNEITRLNGEFLGEITITAIEGGIGYWSTVSEYKWIDREEDVIATIVEDDDGKEWRIDNDVISKGISLILSGGVGVGNRLLKTLEDAVARKDLGDIDSEIADCIVQAGTLGEIVYG